MLKATEKKTYAALIFALLLFVPGVSPVYSQTPDAGAQPENLQEGQIQEIDPEEFSFGMIERISIISKL